MSSTITTRELAERLREQMPVCERWRYFDHAAVGPLCQPAADRLRSWTDDCLNGGLANWSTWRQRVEETRRSGARLLNADPDEIAIVHNTTEGIGIIAEGLDWQPGENLITIASEFPSNRLPWQNLSSRGVECRMVEPPPNAIDGGFGEAVTIEQIGQHCDDRTRLLAISWVGYATGYRHDLDALAEFAHDRGMLLFVDGIQGLGMAPLDVQRTPIDFLSADGHKWLLGPEGAGLLFIRREHLDRLRPIGIGWNSVRASGQFQSSEPELLPTAARYEGGTYNTGGVAALGAALDLLQEFAPDTRTNRLRDVSDAIVDRLRELGITVASDRSETHWSGIVSATLDGISPLKIRDRLRERNILVNARGGRLRISPHLYTNQDDLDALTAALGEMKNVR